MAVVNKSKAAFRTIAEVADELGVATHVLRFWETKFSQIQPMKRSGGRRYYRPDDVELVKKIKYYLHTKRYTIEGVQKILKTKGVKRLLGEEIQKDFFEDRMANVQIDDASRELFASLLNDLQNMKSELQESLAKIKKEDESVN